MKRERSWGFTPAAERTVQSCRELAMGASNPDVWAACLILTLLNDESLASACLKQFGVTPEWLQQDDAGKAILLALAVGPVVIGESEGSGCGPQGTLATPDDPAAFVLLLERARAIAMKHTAEGAISSGVLLLAVVEQNSALRDRLETIGATLDSIRGVLFPEEGSTTAPLALDEPIAIALSADLRKNPMTAPMQTVPDRKLNSPSDVRMTVRILDACLNRCREGLRVLEDFARFLLNDESVCRELKDMRHTLTASEKLLAESFTENAPMHSLLAARNTRQDVGTGMTHGHEYSRETLQDLVTANCRRVQESLRSLEEFGKLVSPEFAAVMKQLRYRSYTVEQDLGQATAACRVEVDEIPTDRLQRARVYVLITEAMCQQPWKVVVETSLAGGAGILQLREKSLSDRELLFRAKWIRDACETHHALFIMNDRPDLATLARAHGTHVGQSELPATEVRTLLSPGSLVGVSTHAKEQLIQAFQQGASYVGVGPVFPSTTKAFQQFPGLEFVQQAAATAAGPWFPIGGITLEHIPALCAAGATRVAVTSAVTQSSSSQQAVRDLLQSLDDHRHALKPTHEGRT